MRRASATPPPCDGCNCCGGCCGGNSCTSPEEAPCWTAPRDPSRVPSRAGATPERVDACAAGSHDCAAPASCAGVPGLHTAPSLLAAQRVGGRCPQLDHGCCCCCAGAHRAGEPPWEGSGPRLLAAQGDDQSTALARPGVAAEEGAGGGGVAGGQSPWANTPRKPTVWGVPAAAVGGAAEWVWAAGQAGAAAASAQAAPAVRMGGVAVSAPVAHPAANGVPHRAPPGAPPGARTAAGVSAAGGHALHERQGAEVGGAV